MKKKGDAMLSQADACWVPTVKAKGAHLNRTETVTVRLDPRLRYLAEVASRRQRRTLSSFIEWAIESSLADVPLSEAENSQSVAQQALLLWDVDEPDRFVKLAVHHPALLTHDEQVLWKLIRENGSLWKGNFAESTGRWSWSVELNRVNLPKLRECWTLLQMVAAGDAPRESLPAWEETDKSKNIPF